MRGEIVCHGLLGKLSRFGGSGAGIERVGRVCKEAGKGMFFSKRHESGGIFCVHRFGAAAPRISREKLKCVCTKRQGSFAHSEQSFGRRQMAANIQQRNSSLT